MQRNRRNRIAMWTVFGLVMLAIAITIGTLYSTQPTSSHKLNASSVSKVVPTAVAVPKQSNPKTPAQFAESLTVGHCTDWTDQGDGKANYTDHNITDMGYCKGAGTDLYEIVSFKTVQSKNSWYQSFKLGDEPIMKWGNTTKTVVIQTN